MELSEKQKNNISKLSSETQIEIMHICAEELGLVSVNDYCEIMNVNRRTVYQHLADKKIKYIELSNTKYPLINMNL